MKKQISHILGILILTIIAVTSCKKDIPKDEINTKWILIKEDTSFIFLPNAFTPDDNGRNDLYKPVYKGIQSSDYSFTVRNARQKILFSTDKLTEFWDGKTDEENEKVGEYIATIKGKFANDTTFEEHCCLFLYRDCVPGGDKVKLGFEAMFDAEAKELAYKTKEPNCE